MLAAERLRAIGDSAETKVDVGAEAPVVFHNAIEFSRRGIRQNSLCVQILITEATRLGSVAKCHERFALSATRA